MKKIFIGLFALAIAISPTWVHAEEKNPKKISESESFIKTVTTIDSAAMYAYNSNTVNRAQSYSEEVSEEEYNEASDSGLVLKGSSYVETTYKKMTTAIWDFGGGYQYVNLLHWKIMPAVRSFDIIGIGFPSAVRASGTPSFSQQYCFSDGSCVTSNTHTPKTSSVGGSSMFQLYPNSITSLDITIWFNIEKNTTSTITTLYAYGDYAHATTSISYENAKNYSMSIGGILLDSSISNYYDSIQSAEVSANVYW